MAGSRRVEEWKSGGVGERRNGRVEEWGNGRTGRQVRTSHHPIVIQTQALTPYPTTSPLPRSHSSTPIHPYTHTPIHLLLPHSSTLIPDLRFPALDASAMAARFRKERLPLYRHVEVHTLLDSQVTPQRLKEEFQWLQRSVRPGQIDTVVVFLSGHGASDREGHYYFPTHLLGH